MAQGEAPDDTPRFEIMPVVGLRAAMSWPAAQIVDANNPAGGDPNLPPGTDFGTRLENLAGPGGGLLIGAQAQVRVTRAISFVAMGAHTEWSTRSHRFAAPAGDFDRDSYDVQGGQYEWGSIGVAGELRIKGVAPISLLVAPGLLRESYPSDDAASEPFKDPIIHRMLALGLEGRFPLSPRIARLTARAGLRDNLVFWNEDEYNLRYREYYDSVGSARRPEVKFDGRSHMVIAYLGVSIGW